MRFSFIYIHMHLTLLQAASTVVTELPVYHIAITAILMLVSLFFGAIAAGAEVALFTLNVKDVNYLKTRTDKPSMQIVEMIEHPNTLLSTLRTAKVTAAVIVVMASIYLAKILMPAEVPQAWSNAIVMVFSAVLLLLVIEILPKVYARQNNVRMAMFSISFVSLMFLFFKNFVPSKEEDKEQLDRELKKKSSVISEEEFKETVALRLGKEPGKEELDIFKGIMKFSEITVKQVMQPRMNISGIRERWDLSQVRDKVVRSRFSRMPVYKETIDQIVGMLHTKDLIQFMQEEQEDWHSLIRPALFIPEGKLIEDLFQEFQQQRVHAAIVVDEFGGTSGLVTLEDIVEEVVGEIRDEFDEDVLNFKKLDDHTFIFDGKTLINEMCRVLDVDINTFEQERGESTSVAGLVLEVAKKFPAVGEEIHINDYKFIVMAIEKLHIERVKVIR